MQAEMREEKLKRKRTSEKVFERAKLIDLSS